VKTSEYLDLAKSKAGISSDYALAVKIGATRQAVSRWRQGGNPDPLYAAKIAELAQVEPLLVIADIEIEKANTAHRPTVTAEWRSLLSRLGGVAAAMALGTLLSAPTPSQARAVAQIGGEPVYIMLT
jgi:transcriptional regulator with XRE-family HTH domain